MENGTINVFPWKWYGFDRVYFLYGTECNTTSSLSDRVNRCCSGESSILKCSLAKALQLQATIVPIDTYPRDAVGGGKKKKKESH